MNTEKDSVVFIEFDWNSNNISVIDWPLATTKSKNKILLTALLTIISQTSYYRQSQPGPTKHRPAPSGNRPAPSGNRPAPSGDRPVRWHYTKHRPAML